MYPFQKMAILIKNIPDALFGNTFKNIHQSIIPSNFVIGMVLSKVYASNILKNPLTFEHFGVESERYYVNGKWS